MGWLALQLEVDGPRAEPLSEALLELGAHSVTIEDAQADTAAELPQYGEPGSGVVAGWSRNRICAIVDPAIDVAALVGAAADSAGLRAPPVYEVTPIEEEDWVRRTQSQFGPARIGEHLWVVPSWAKPPDERDAVVVRLDPGLAFGTGSHPTTRLALSWLERALGAARGRRLRVLDYGCGSGILGIAAAKLGAAEVIAIDIDPQALAACAANARANTVSIEVAEPQALPAGHYDLIVANILARPLAELAPVFSRVTQTGALIALSGILAGQAEGVRAAYASTFRLSIDGLDGWALLACDRI